jgi:hypothetical protein
VRLLAYEEAVRLYRMALGLHRSADATRCELLLAVGDAQARSGDADALKQTFREAAELADSLGLPEQLARAALGYGGRMIWDVSRDADYLETLLDQALARCPTRTAPSGSGSSPDVPEGRCLTRAEGGSARSGWARRRSTWRDDWATPRRSRARSPGTSPAVRGRTSRASSSSLPPSPSCWPRRSATGSAGWRPTSIDCSA